MQKGSQIIANVIMLLFVAAAAAAARSIVERRNNFPCHTRKAFSSCGDCRAKTWTEFTSHLQFYNSNDFYRYLFHSFSFSNVFPPEPTTTEDGKETSYVVLLFPGSTIIPVCLHLLQENVRPASIQQMNDNRRAFKEGREKKFWLSVCLPSPFTTDQHCVLQLEKQLQRPSAQNQCYLCSSSQRDRRCCCCPFLIRGPRVERRGV